MLSARDRALAVTDPPTLKTASVDMAASGDRAVVILSLYDKSISSGGGGFAVAYS